MNQEKIRIIWTIFLFAQSNGTYSKSIWLIQNLSLIDWDNVLIIDNEYLSKLSILGFPNQLILLTQSIGFRT